MRIEVRGTPGPQGSKRYVGNGILLESSAKVKPWREAVKWAAIESLPYAGFLFHGPLHVEMHFTLPKPKSCPKSRKYPDRSPDLDKLVRSTDDALTQAGIWEDDARVVRIVATKNFPGANANCLPCPGVTIFIDHAE
jgi:Holliday junction resolvase RusA-like endonuclease